MQQSSRDEDLEMLGVELKSSFAIKVFKQKQDNGWTTIRSSDFT
jgi:hypothetical protein